MLSTFILWTYIQSIVFINAESLIDLPLKIPKRNVIIHATLTDTSSGEMYFLQEFISANSDVQGKIEIDSKSDSSEIHYSMDKSNQRLVVQETQCDLLTYKSGWDKKLPGINKPLLNLLLLLGPSLFYRLNHATLTWNNASDANVRGTMMHSATATMNTRLKITNYFKTKMDEGIAKPNRIIFEGNDPGAPISPFRENLILDIYLQDEVDYELADFIQIPPGIGCPIYLAQGIPFPVLKVHTIQMIVLENLDGPSSSSTKSEFYIDDEHATMRLISTTLGIKTDAIYDYNLGLIYVKEEQNCLVSPLALSSPGVNEAGYYSVYNLLWLNKSYLYLGQLDFEQRPGFQVRAWEATEYNMMIGSAKYDKIVTTLYFAESKDSDTFNDYILVGATRKSYKKGSAGDYLLIETSTRDFYDFKKAVSDSGFAAQFQLDDCFQDAESRIELDFQLSCASSNCYKDAQSRPEEFKNLLKLAILNDKKISPLRVSTADVKFGYDRINVFMSFLAGPKIDEPFRKRSLTVDQKYLRKLGPLTANDEKACLVLQSSIVAPIKTVIYCGKLNTGNCYHLETVETIATDPKGPLCSVWDFPLNNLYRVGHELTLEEIHSNMLDKSMYNLLSLQAYGHRYTVENVIDITKKIEEDTQLLYAISRHSSKLKTGSRTVDTVPDAKNFGSCYRACVHSDEGLCESFSYCEYGKKVECLVTSTMYDKIDDDAIIDDRCNIYSKNHLYDYHEIRRRRFISPTSISTRLPLYDCATFCYASEDCYSFQYCNGFCTFAGVYTDSATEHREDCDIYSPKASHKYQLTGDKIVVETFHTEFNLNLEQCAALCDDWKTGDESCKSFNYCPKGRTPSSCYLSRYTVEDGKTMKIESGECHNYGEIINKHDGGKARNDKSIKGTSSGSAFGIILLFLVGGLIVGFAAPIGYSRFSTLPSFTSMISFSRTTTTNEPQFGWSKQVNDDENQSRV